MTTSILNPSIPLKTCQEFIEYWDSWHKEWYNKATSWIGTGILPLPADNILGWPIPPDPIWRDFPEPYWGNPCEPKAIFLNINPGGGGGNLRLPAMAGNPLYTLYNTMGNSYSKTIMNPAIPTIYPAGYYWHNNRAIWGSQICNDVIPWHVNEILNIDLVPWHTVTAAQINGYVAIPGVCDLIRNKVLIPAIHISNTVSTCFKNNIIGKGSVVQNTIEMPCFNTILTPPIPIAVPSPGIYTQIAPNVNKINRWHISNTVNPLPICKIKVYVGGRNMALPPITIPIDRVYQNGTNPPDIRNLREIIDL